MENQFLYHYTKISTFEKILRTRSIRFNRLDFVDDLDEVKAEDIKDFGKFCFVSCWTDAEKDSIPMWSMYSQNMTGIRIKLKTFPFKKYPFPSGAKENGSTHESYINIEERKRNNQPYILGNYPLLFEVQYTDNQELLFPHIKSIDTSPPQIQTIVKNGKKITRTKTHRTENFQVSKIGRYKSKDWEFQQEWRYFIFVVPYSYDEMDEIRKKKGDFSSLTHRLEDPKYSLNEKEIFLKLDDIAVSEMEILIGPRADKEAFDYVVNIAMSAGIDKSHITQSELQIR